MTRESDFFRAVSRRGVVRPRVASIVIEHGRLLVQRPIDDPGASYAFIGGEYEVGDTFLSRLRAEFEEETSARLIAATYLFVVENRFKYGDAFFHSLEHYLLAKIDRVDVESRERHLGFHWLPVDTLADYDVRPAIVRDVIVSGEYADAKHLIVPFESSA